VQAPFGFGLRIPRFLVAILLMAAPAMSRELTTVARQPLIALASGGTFVLPHGAALLGPLAGTTLLRLAVGLAPRHQALLTHIADVRAHTSPAASPFKALSPSEFAASFAPTSGEMARLTGYLQDAGLRVTHTYGGRLLIDVAGMVYQVEQAFGLKLLRYRARNGAVYYVNETAPQLPANLAPLVTSVVGLRDDTTLVHAPLPRQTYATTRPRSSGRRFTIPPPPAGLLTPAQLRAAYNVTRLYSQTVTTTAGLSQTIALTGLGQTIALYELSPYDPRDVAAYDAAFGISATPPISIRVDGGATDAFAGKGATEATLDVEMVQAIAPGAQIIVYQSPSIQGGGSSASIDDAYARAIDDNRAQVLSTSWGQCEQQQQADQPPDLTLLHNLFAQATAEGITVVAASGDSGAYDCFDANDQPDTTQHALDYPASDPSVLAVGGTTLVMSGSMVVSESSWSGSGGGVSILYGRPSWQSGIGALAAGGGRRGVPDVAVNAGTPYAIWVSNGWEPVKGTSAGPPLWSALLALINQDRYAVAAIQQGADPPAPCAVTQGMGDIHAILYSVGTAGAFRDITTGPDNGAGAVAPGWDMVTGLGAPDALALARTLIAAPSLVPAAPGFCPPVLSPTTAPTTVPIALSTSTPRPIQKPHPTPTTTPRPAISLIVSVAPSRVAAGGFVTLRLHVRGLAGVLQRATLTLRYPGRTPWQFMRTTDKFGGVVVRVRVPVTLRVTGADLVALLRVGIQINGHAFSSQTSFHVVRSLPLR